MPRSKPFAHLRSAFDRDPERRRRVAELKRAMLDALRASEPEAEQGRAKTALKDPPAPHEHDPNRE